jgi:hypothetical protein
MNYNQSIKISVCFDPAPPESPLVQMATSAPDCLDVVLNKVISHCLNGS